eukprot:6486027-Amphidinium_carterae.1
MPFLQREGRAYRNRCLAVEGGFEYYLRRAKEFHYNFSRVPAAFLGDKAFMLRAIEVRGGCLFYAPAHLRDDIEVVWPCVQRRPTALQCASDRLKNDREL